ncbi:hypothetical protein PHACT_12670 [Pseudohongiella acticola]|uniref:Uncharacterized protein n=1 Tax=Pseudohongiella acticola TaxID=1524254 RepID=A0A1E8CG18_9GAMM|nr:hypothetical protein [Pseudohongiella acticola]OFE11404.1 hypothetical protein PHACT_12670 [Pseudohongiella acticola]
MTFVLVSLLRQQLEVRMVGREMLPLSFDHSIYDGAVQDLVDAARGCLMTRAEQRCLVEFITAERSYGYLFRTRAIERPPGFSIVVTLLPGYLRLLSALRAGAPQTMDLIRSELARRQDAQGGVV